MLSELLFNPGVLARTGASGQPSSRAQRALAVIQQWPGYAPTPLHSLTAVAGSLGLGAVLYKDEAHRFGLHSFKALGAAYAVQELLDAGELAPGASVCAATAGNHGRSLAWGAQMFGCRCEIFVASSVQAVRRQAIERFGARIHEVAGTYDDAVARAREAAQENGWLLVSDTSSEDYRRIPGIVMDGYTVISSEIAVQLADQAPPTHVLVQAGVGGLAAALASELRELWGAERPVFIVVEPAPADCLLRSLRAGRPIPAPEAGKSVMLGLACEHPSLVAWDILSRYTDWFCSIRDTEIQIYMRALAQCSPPIVAGESGVTGFMALHALGSDAGARAKVGFGSSSRVLLIGTEGATEPVLYERLVGRAPKAVYAGAGPGA